MNSPLEGARIVIVGYDTEARDHALALRRANNRVVIGALRDSAAATRASDDGFVVDEGGSVVASADVVAVRGCEDLALWRRCESRIAGGALVVFASARALHAGGCASSGMDVVLVTGIENASAGCRIAVHRDVSRNALVRAFAYARAVYAAGVPIHTTHVCDEAERMCPSSPRNANAEPPANDAARWFYEMLNQRGAW